MNEYFKKKEEFYPTPKSLAEKMCQYLDGSERTILEPSAGKGDLIEAVIARFADFKKHTCDEITVDVAEKDAEFRDILSSRYSEASVKKLGKEARALSDRHWIWNSSSGTYECGLSEEEKIRLENLVARYDVVSRIDLKVVAEDFLEYRTWKKYDAIIMNPPFSEADKHLLKAISLMRFGGKIICLLNKETIINPYTNVRKLLVRKLEELDAEIEYLPMEFTSDDTERKTTVEVALVKMTIPEGASYKSQILEGLDKAREERRTQSEATEVSTATTWIDALIEQCEYELEAGLRLYSEYMAIKPYMSMDYDNNSYSRNIIELKCGKNEFDPNSFARAVRAKYWRKFFSNDEFQKALTSNLSQTFHSIVNDAAEYEFTTANVIRILDKMNVLLNVAREDTILELFDKLSSEHSWFPESKNNVHYYNGWATNKAHKINDRKIILPINGFSAYNIGKLDTYKISCTLSDIEKVFNYLAVGSDAEFPEYNMSTIVDSLNNTGRTKNIPFKYFFVTFYKKGTCHITFRDEAKPLIEKLNIFGSQKKGWLPPCYGKKAYCDMTPEERTVIDEFQGEELYAAVISKSDYYLDSGAGFNGVFALESA